MTGVSGIRILIIHFSPVYTRNHINIFGPHFLRIFKATVQFVVDIVRCSLSLCLECDVY